MSINRKIIIIMILLLGIGGISFAETYHSFSTGYYRLSDIFFKDNFGRELNGVNVNFSFYYFPGKSPMGLFIQTTFGAFTSGYEWKGDDEMDSIDYDSIADLRIAFTPSLKLQLGPKVRIPFSLGPALCMYRENGGRSFYEAFNLGLMADTSIIFTPGRHFFLRPGVGLGWDILHVEKGEMSMSFRDTKRNRAHITPYSALAFSLYFGVGIRFN